jgi:hypothetical protein
MTNRRNFLGATSMFVVAIAVMTACSSTATSGMPTPALTEAEIESQARDASSFAKEHLEAWPDIDAFVADYTADYAFADPTWRDFRVGSDNVRSMLVAWESMTDYTIDVTASYISAKGAAFEETWPGLQPPMQLPPDPPVASGLTVYTFNDGDVASQDLWYRVEDNIAYGIGCFAVNDCEALQNSVDRYLTAWTARESESISGLYSPNATFSDSILGLTASGSAAIGQLGDERFGSNEGLEVEVLDLYAWTAGTTPPSDSTPNAGQLIGVAIHYRATVDGTSETQEALTTLVLGHRTKTGIEADPDGLIHHEEVFHSAETLLASLQADTP